MTYQASNMANVHELKPFKPNSNVDNSQRYDRALWRTEEDMQYDGFTPDYGTMIDSEEEEKTGFFQKHK